MTTSELHEYQFRQHVVQLGYGKSSVNMLPSLVGDFLQYHGITDVTTITSHHIETFHQHLQERPNKRYDGGLSENYIHQHIYSLKVFFNWLEQTGQVKHNPISSMKFKRPAATPRQPLTREEVTRLFESYTTRKETAMLHLFYSCGLRRSEAAALDIADIHLKSRLLHVRSGKGKKRRVVPLTVVVSNDLETYFLQERTTVEQGHDQEAFMLDKKGRRASGNTLYNTVKDIMQRAGIASEASPHHLRHSIATHLLESGLAIEQVCDFLGHKHLEATQVYTKVTRQQVSKL